MTGIPKYHVVPPHVQNRVIELYHKQHLRKKIIRERLGIDYGSIDLILKRHSEEQDARKSESVSTTKGQMQDN